MVTVYHEANALSIPDDLALAAGLREGARVDLSLTPEGVLVRGRPLTREDKIAVAESLRGEGRRLLPNAGNQVEALLRDRAEDDALDLEDERV